MGATKYDANGNVVTAVEVNGSTIMQPMDVQFRLQTTIQTHNAVSVAATTGISAGSWIDCNGFDKIAFTLLNDAATASSADLQWSNDGTNQHGLEAGVIPGNTQRYKQGIADVKARYCRLVLGNTDAAAHTMSAWAYLKV